MCSCCRSSLSQRPLRTRYHHIRSSALYCDPQRRNSTGSTRPDCNWTMKFRSQRSSHMEPSATSTAVTWPVRERLQAGTEDAPVFDRPAPLRRLHVSGAGYKYLDLLTYLLWSYLLVCDVCKSELDSCKTARWEKYLIGAMRDETLQPSDELKSLLREGVPPQIRSQVWKAYVTLFTLLHTSSVIYYQLRGPKNLGF